MKGGIIMRLTNEWYDKLKWIVMVCIPAATTAYVGLAGIWGFPYSTEIAKTSAVVCAFLGAILGMSNIQYKKGGEPDEPKAEGSST